MQHFIGIDFSGGVKAGRKIWIASGRVENDALAIDACIRGEALPDSSRDRAECLPALHAFIRTAGDALIGLDFPLGLPRELMQGQTWLQFIRVFADRFGTPQQFRQACLRVAQGRELKRRLPGFHSQAAKLVSSLQRLVGPAARGTLVDSAITTA